MGSNRILYVSYDPHTLVRDEELLMRAGYEVASVLGTDGLIACGSVADYSSVLLDHACPVEERPEVISWLKSSHPEVTILPAEWAQMYAASAGPAPPRVVFVPSTEPVHELTSKSSPNDYAAVPTFTGFDKRSDDVSRKDVSVDFRLFYRGELPPWPKPEAMGKQQIHLIRKHFHQQLQLLWQQHRALAGALTRPTKSPRQESLTPMLEVRAGNYARCGYRFLPLVSRDSGSDCSLDILLLRHDDPARLVQTAGGIDYRVPLLLAALRMPRTCDEAENGPDANEDPFYVLMDDDSTVKEVKVSNDRLLTPVTPQEPPHYVVLIIQVRASVTALG
jgi:hypothetical protein